MANTGSLNIQSNQKWNLFGELSKEVERKTICTGLALFMYVLPLKAPLIVSPFRGLSAATPKKFSR